MSSKLLVIGLDGGTFDLLLSGETGDYAAFWTVFAGGQLGSVGLYGAAVYGRCLEQLCDG